MALSQTAVPPITETLDGYMEAFNALDLDRVMTHFADDAVYRPGSGVERVGRAAIRDELEPQFDLAYGAMRFDECDRIVDDKARKIVIRWVCRHDLAYAKPKSLAWKIRRVIAGAVVGNRFGWEGVDVFHFDDAGKIKRKFTYAGYRQPRLEKQLGVPLPTPSRHTSAKAFRGDDERGRIHRNAVFRALRGALLSACPPPRVERKVGGGLEHKQGEPRAHRRVGNPTSSPGRYVPGVGSVLPIVCLPVADT